MDTSIQHIISLSNLKWKSIVFIIFGLLLPGFVLQATHIVGGSIRYNCLGNDQYEIILTVHRDCNLGANDAEFDDPASVGIFDPNGRLLTEFGIGGQVLLDFRGDEQLQNEIKQICFSNNSNICVHVTEYKEIVTLPKRSAGYILAYQRCCRNASLSSVVSPLESGMTLSIELTPAALEVCNNSPSFNLTPDIFICEDEELTFDGVATDADGDQLVYNLCVPLNGASISEPNPKPPGSPPYEPIEWVQGFSELNPFGPASASYDVNTGTFISEPSTAGQYLVGMCVEEYRNGELLSIVRREFQYNVVACNNEIVSDFEVQQNGCSLDNVQFINNTESATEFTWFFNFPSEDPAFISNEQNPTFSYPQAGTYPVRLVASNPQLNCESILDRDITISEGGTDPFRYTILSCQGDQFRVRLSDVSLLNTTTRDWNVNVNGQTITSSSQNIEFTANKDAAINAVLTLTSGTGCVETQERMINLNFSDFDAELLSCSSGQTNLDRLIFRPSAVPTELNNQVVSYAWTINNGSINNSASGQTFESDVDYSNPVNVSLTVQLANGCQLQTQRTIDLASVDICAQLAENPNNPIGALDCDGDGFTNSDECNRGSDPVDGCSIPEGETIDICAILAADPESPLGMFDCDEGGTDNATECENGTDPNNPGDDDECASILNGTIDICAILAANPNSPLATLDCDGDGIDNATECENGSDPANGCDFPEGEVIDICALLAADPNSPLGALDCDGDGFTNADECNRGSDPSDGCSIPEGEVIDICAILEADPDNPLGKLDCDDSGIDNETECDNGTDPNNPNDDDACKAILDGTIDICAILSENPDSPLGALDCDGDGIDNATECDNGSDPTDGCDFPVGETVDICAIIAADPNSPLGMLDCDNGGIDNATECENGGNPNDPNDECLSAYDETVDICAILSEDPDSPLGALDCDGDGFTNADECNRGSDPADGCSIPEGETIDICAILAADPDSPLGMFDCDNGGIDNATECENGGDPNDPSDECLSAFDDSVDICAILAADPDSPLGALDCDGDGFTNADECNRGSDPSDGCSIPEGEMIDICAILADDPDSPLGMFDCDNGGVDNKTECDSGTDPNNPSDDDECDAILNGTLDICALLEQIPIHPLGALDCDGDGFTNADECERGSDPADGCSIPEGETIDICAILAADPDSPLGMFDCDNGGIDNATECENGGDPNDPSDECLSAFDESVDICAILAENPDSPLGALDCDGDGFTNADECNRGSDPVDGCSIPEGEMIDICAILAEDPDSPIGMFDCDNGGADNATECENGGDPNDPSDECDSIDETFDICAFLAENPDSPLGALDCDGDGVDNSTECNNGTDPLDPNDSCPQSVSIDVGDGLGIPAGFCTGQDTEIFITPLNSDSLIYEWGPADCIVSGTNTASPTINVTDDKDLILRVMNLTLNCSSDTIIPVSPSMPTATVSANPDGEIPLDTEVDITVDTDATDPVFDWSTGDTGSSISVVPGEGTTTYVVTVTDAFGCQTIESIDVVTLAIDCTSNGVYLPNAFTPNGDGSNDVLFVRSNSIMTMELSIFDRWGREVFRSTSIDVGWNGRWQNNGDELPSDAYAYWLRATCRDGQEFDQQGNVTLLR